MGRHRLNDLAALALGQRNGRKPRIIGAVTRSDNRRRLSRENAKAVSPSPRGACGKMRIWRMFCARACAVPSSSCVRTLRLAESARVIHESVDCARFLPAVQNRNFAESLSIKAAFSRHAFSFLLADTELAWHLGDFPTRSWMRSARRSNDL